MSKQQSYRQIFKATSLFGGVQIIIVLTGILRSKFVAIFLGPTGMGISGLFVSTVTLISTISGLGLNFSAVRDISQANESGDIKRLNTTLTVFRRLILFSCSLGAILLMVFSSWLSQLTFGNKNYTWSFIFLSGMLVFNILANGNTALLEGTRNLKSTAKSTIIGSIVALVTTVPLYYYWGTKGIVPALIISAVMTFLTSAFYARKIKLIKVEVSRKETIALGSEMAKLGLVMVCAQLLGFIVTYIINTFVRSKGGFADVGLYQAGTSITNQSVGLVFTSIAIDYFPRLSAVSHDDKKIKEIVNQQGVITVLIASPLLIALIVFAPVFIHILLSGKFFAISDFIRWLALGTFFTVPMVVIGYIPLAKSDKKNYFLYGSLFNNLLLLVFSICGYLINGLIGMAISFFIFQILYIIFVSYKFYILYSFIFSKQFLSIFLILSGFCCAALISSLLLKGLVAYLLGGAILSLSVCYSWQKLDKLIGIKSHIKEKIIKNR
jgi:O-antigen/teichoic acid export membrane protein